MLELIGTIVEFFFYVSVAGVVIRFLKSEVIEDEGKE